MSRRTKSQAIGEKGEAVFEALLPMDISPNPIRRDYGIDYICKSFDAGVSNEIYFFAQVKSKTTYPIQKGCIAIELETEKISDYVVKNQAIPFFLFGIDITNNKGYWTFLHDYIWGESRIDGLCNQTFMTIRIPVESDLSDHSKFMEAVSHSYDYMKRFHADSVVAMIKARELFLRSLDPRALVSITATGHSEHYHLDAIEPIPLNVQIKGDDAFSKFRSLFTSGEAITFTSDEMSVSGSPLYEYVFKSLGPTFSLQLKPTDRPTMEFFDPLAADMKPILRFPVGISANSSHIIIDGGLDNSALQFSAKIDRNLTSGSFDVGRFYSPQEWTGQPVAELPFLDEVHAFFTHAVNTNCVNWAVTFQGKNVFEGSVRINKVDVQRNIEILALLRKARWIARRFSLDVVLPECLSNAEVNSIVTLYDLLNTGSARLRVKGNTINADFDRAGIPKILEIMASSGKEYSELVLGPREDLTQDLFGKDINVGPIELSIEKTRIANVESLKKESELEGDSPVTVEFFCASDGKMTLMQEIGPKEE